MNGVPKLMAGRLPSIDNPPSRPRQTLRHRDDVQQNVEGRPCRFLSVPMAGADDDMNVAIAGQVDSHASRTLPCRTLQKLLSLLALVTTSLLFVDMFCNICLTFVL